MKAFRPFAIGLLVSVAFVTPALSHKEWVHQHMVKQAYLLLQAQLGSDIPAMTPFVGMGVSGPGYRKWRTRTIVNGAWREDIEDVVWHTGECSPEPCVAPGFDASSTHFWDADAGDWSTIDIPMDGFGGIGNSFFKASAILDPTIYPWYVYYQTDAAQQWHFTTIDNIEYTIPNLYHPTSVTSPRRLYQCVSWISGFRHWLSEVGEQQLPVLVVGTPVSCAA